MRRNFNCTGYCATFRTIHVTDYKTKQGFFSKPSAQQPGYRSQPESLCHWGMRQSGVQMAEKNPPCWCMLDREQHPILKERSFTSQSALLHKRWDSLWPLHRTAGSGDLSGRFRLLHRFLVFRTPCQENREPRSASRPLSITVSQISYYLSGRCLFTIQQSSQWLVCLADYCLLLAFRSDES